MFAGDFCAISPEKRIFADWHLLADKILFDLVIKYTKQDLKFQCFRGKIKVHVKVALFIWKGHTFNK